MDEAYKGPRIRIRGHITGKKPTEMAPIDVPVQNLSHNIKTYVPTGRPRGRPPKRVLTPKVRVDLSSMPATVPSVVIDPTPKDKLTKKKPGRPRKDGKDPIGRLKPVQARMPAMAIVRKPPSTAKSASNRSAQNTQFAHENPLMAGRVPIPPDPTYDPNGSALSAMLYEDQQIARVEQLMLKGMRAPRLIASALGMPDQRKVERWMVRVNARWEVSGGGVRLKRYRGEHLARIHMFRNELSVVLSNVRPDGQGHGDARAFIVCIQQLRELDRMENDAMGLTPNAVERLNAITDEDNEVLARIEKQQATADMAKRFAFLTGITAGLKTHQDAAMANTNSDINIEPGHEIHINATNDTNDTNATDDTHKPIPQDHIPQDHIPLGQRPSSGDNNSDSTAFVDMGPEVDCQR